MTTSKPGPESETAEQHVPASAALEALRAELLLCDEQLAKWGLHRERTVASIDAYLDPRGQVRGARPFRPSDITEREFEVLNLVVGGITNKEIAGTLHISENTVRAHVRSLMQRTSMDNRAQVTAWAVKARLVDVSTMTLLPEYLPRRAVLPPPAAKPPYVPPYVYEPAGQVGQVGQQENGHAATTGA